MTILLSKVLYELDPQSHYKSESIKSMVHSKADGMFKTFRFQIYNYHLNTKLKNCPVCKWSGIQMASEYRTRKSRFWMAGLCGYHFVLSRQNVDQNDLVTTYSNDHCLNFQLWSYETFFHLNTGLRKSFERLTYCMCYN